MKSVFQVYYGLSKLFAFIKLFHLFKRWISITVFWKCCASPFGCMQKRIRVRFRLWTIISEILVYYVVYQFYRACRTAQRIRIYYWIRAAIAKNGFNLVIYFLNCLFRYLFSLYKKKIKKFLWYSANVGKCLIIPVWCMIFRLCFKIIYREIARGCLFLFSVSFPGLSL